MTGISIRTNSNAVLNGIDEIVNGGGAGLRTFGFNHDGLDTDSEARIKIAQQRCEIYRRLDKSVRGEVGLTESYEGNS